MFGTLTLVNLLVWVSGNRPDGPADIVLLAGITSLPLFPIVGFHLHQARLQFNAGHTLADLRTALDIAARERAETEALVSNTPEGRGSRLLRIATVASAVVLAILIGLTLDGPLKEKSGAAIFLSSLFTTMLLGAVSNALDVQFIPTRLRNWWQSGLRERLWNSRAGEWLARRLGAPEQSRAVGGGVFRATEAALGVAAGELYAALPQAFREQLADLPGMVAALEAFAAEARAELEVVASLAPAGSNDADVLAARRAAASSRLGKSVAALEAIRLDLLRLHAGAADVAPRTTLIDAARLLGDDMNRLADAQREVEQTLGKRARAELAMPTPA